MDGITCIKPAHYEHCSAEPKTAVDGTVSGAPFVGQEERRDGHAEYDNGGNSRSKKGSFRRGESCLREKNRCILDMFSLFLCGQHMETR